MNFYSTKHQERAERGLKKAYFPEYVLSQMTIDDELRSLKEKRQDVEDKVEEVRKKPKHTAQQIQQSLQKKRSNRNSDNLFSSEAGELELQTAKKRFKK